ncbi:MAG: GAF domain-containing protein [Geminicoccaceae bacterium]
MSVTTHSLDLAGISRQLAAAGQPEPACKAVHDAVRAACGHSFTTLLLVRPDGHAQRVYSSNLEAYPLQYSKPFPDGLLRQVLEARQPLLVRNMDEYRTIYFREDVFMSTGARSLLTLPVCYDGKAFAAICLGAPEGVFDERIAEALEPAVAMLGPVMALLQPRYA